MAQKTSKQIDKYIKNTFDFKKGCLVRNPKFIEDVKECWQNIKNKPSKSFKFKIEFFRKYGFILPKEEHLKQPQVWLSSGYSNIVLTISSDKEIRDKFSKGESPRELLEKRIRNDIRYERGLFEFLDLKNMCFWKKFTPLTPILENGRFWTVRVDTNRDVGVIKRIFLQELKGIKQLKKEYKIGAKFDGTLHLDKTKRYFDVFDLRAQKPPLTYKNIALNLIKAGYYKNKSLEQVIESAKKDFGVAFKGIYGIVYKQYNKKEFKKSDYKSCKDCQKMVICKELCAEVEYYLLQVEVKQAHLIGKKGDAMEWANI